MVLATSSDMPAKKFDMRPQWGAILDEGRFSREKRPFFVCRHCLSMLFRIFVGVNNSVLEMSGGQKVCFCRRRNRQHSCAKTYFLHS